MLSKACFFTPNQSYAHGAIIIEHRYKAQLKKFISSYMDINQGPSLIIALSALYKGKSISQANKLYFSYLLEPFPESLHDEIEVTLKQIIINEVALLLVNYPNLNVNLPHIFTNLTSCLTRFKKNEIWIYNMSDYEIIALFNLIKVTQLSHFDFSRFNMPFWSARVLKAFSSLLINSQLESLDLRDNTFKNHTTTWRTISKIIQRSNVANLNLSNCFMIDVQNAEHCFVWEDLFRMFKYSSLKKINLNANRLYVLTPEQWQNFKESLKNPSIKSLDLSCNYFGSYFIKEPLLCQSLLDTLEQSNLEDLNLDVCYINKIPKELWNNFRSMLQKSGLKSLSLHRNYLNELGAESWEQFCNALSHSSLTRLNLRLNDLNELQPSAWQHFGNMLKTTPLMELNLIENNLHLLSEDQWSAFTNALRGTHITSVKINLSDSMDEDSRWRTELSEVQSQELQDILNSNKTSAETVTFCR